MGASRSADFSLFDSYPVRIMLGLVASLSLMLALVRLPLQTSVKRVGWSTHSPERIALSDIRPEEPPEKEAEAKGTEKAPPPTAQRAPRPDQPARSLASEDPGAESTQRDSGRTTDSARNDLRSVATLGIEDQRPHVKGGLGSLYLHINYPEEARREGIEGRVKLEFTVESNGKVRDIEVVDSLHPLCDSAAVKGVRSVNFVPAKQNGTPIPIRLKLPIRFELTAVSSTMQSNGPQR